MDSTVLGYIVLAIFATPVVVGSCAMMFLQSSSTVHMFSEDGSATTYNPMRVLVSRTQTPPVATQSSHSLPHAA